MLNVGDDRWVDDFVDAVGLELELVLDKSSLKVAHAADSLLDAAVQDAEGAVGHRIDPA